MEKRAPHISGKGSIGSSGSIFKIPAKLEPVGSSTISLAVAPSMEADFETHTKSKVEYENTYRMDPTERQV